MMMNKRARPALFAFLILCVFLTASYSQDVSPAAQAYKTWKEKRLAAGELADGNHICVAYAVTGSKDNIAKISIAVGVGSNVSVPDEMKFTVQPVIAKKDADGKNVFEAIGEPGNLRFPDVENSKDPKNDLVAELNFTIPAPAGATAMKITVTVKNSNYSAVLPLTHTTNTATLGGKIETDAALGKVVPM